jgi:transcriptional regulator with XRE-family HTH domain
MDVLRDQDAATRKATLSRILKIFRRRSGLKSVEIAKLMNKGLRTYQRWESGHYGVQIDPIYRFAEIVQVDPWAIIFGAEFGSVDFALDASRNSAASFLLVALRRAYRKSPQPFRGLDPRSLLLTYTRGFELLDRRFEKYDSDLEQWMFDAGLGADDDPDEQDDN